MSWGYWLKAWLKAWTRLLQADFFTSILVLFVPNGVDLFVFNFLEEKGKKKNAECGKHYYHTVCTDCICRTCCAVLTTFERIE